MGFRCFYYSTNDELRLELQRMLDELYTPEAVPTHPDFDRECFRCAKNGGCVGICDSAKHQSMSYAEFKERTAQLESRMTYLEQNADALSNQCAELSDRLAQVESVLDARQPQQLEAFTAELLPVFNLREAILKMQLDRMVSGQAPANADMVSHAIDSVDRALSMGATRDPNAGCAETIKSTSKSRW